MAESAVAGAGVVSWAVSGPSASSAILRILIRSTGYSLEEIAHVAGLSPDRLSGASISYGDGLRVWEGVAELVGDPVLGHSVGCGLRLHHVGVFGPLVAHAEDVRQGLLATCRALSLALPEGGLTTSETVDSLTIRYVRPDFPMRVRHGVESLFATLVSLAREASGQRVSPERVSLTSAPPPDRAVFDDYYDAAVEFEAAVDELFFRGPLLAHRMIGDEPALLRVLEERATEVLAASGVEGRAIRACRELFDAGREVTVEAAARQLGASARTLQRKLSGEGRSFRQVRDAAARAIAEELLREGRASVDEIAERVGYTSRSAFERAFTRWTGITPSRWRRER